ncbi:MAG: peptidoglycan-binding protein, partial [Clostridia bacterium]|nr:peptidoglycan-binding protein [Clostridia bacterium]
MTYSDSRGDYDSDETFANFRGIVMGDIPEGWLYRSASGIDDSHGRSAYVNALYAENGIVTVLNLAESAEEVEALITERDTEDFYSELFREGRVIAGGSLGIDMTAEAFKQTLALDLREMLAQEGP